LCPGADEIAGAEYLEHDRFKWKQQEEASFLKKKEAKNFCKLGIGMHLSKDEVLRSHFE